MSFQKQQITNNSDSININNLVQTISSTSLPKWVPRGIKFYVSHRRPSDSNSNKMSNPTGSDRKRTALECGGSFIPCSLTITLTLNKLTNGKDRNIYKQSGVVPLPFHRLQHISFVFRVCPSFLCTDSRANQGRQIS